jgi:hypothetical protein
MSPQFDGILNEVFLISSGLFLLVYAIFAIFDSWSQFDFFLNCRLPIINILIYILKYL